MRPQPLADTLARDTDPTTSQDAARDAATRVREVRFGVLKLVQAHGRLSASRINSLYARNYAGMGWKRAAPDSPRKRAGELADPHRGLLYLAVVDTAVGENFRAESVYALTDRGLAYLKAQT